MKYSNTLALVIINELHDQMTIETMLEEEIVSMENIEFLKKRNIIEVTTAGGESYVTNINNPLQIEDKVITSKLSMLGLLLSVYIIIGIFV